MMGFRNLSVQKLLCAASVSVVALGFAQPSLAQQAAPQGQADAADNAVGDIIVTAQFREQRLQDTPIAITAVNAALMEQRSQTNLSDVVKQAPNVQLLPATAAFGPSISASIRGLGQGDFNPALEPGVGLYIDDVYYPRLTGANFDLMDVERVEILRGPQGTLTGRNSEGGAIKFVSRKPTGDGSGFVQATYGSRNRINLRAGADVKLTDTLFLRLSGAYADQDGYVKNINFACANPFGGLPVVQSGSSCVNDTHGDVGYRALRGILRFAPSDAVDLTISADYIKDVRNQGAEVLLYANNPSPAVAAATGVPFDSRFICGRFCNYATYQQSAGPFLGPVATGSPLVATKGDPRSRYEGWGVSGNLTVKLSEDINVTSISAYRQWRSRFTADGDLSPAQTGLGLNDLHHWFVSQELRMNVRLSDMINLTIGGYYSDERTTYWTMQDIRYAAIPLQFIGNDPVNTDSKALFGTIVVKPIEAMTITLGTRYTDEHKDYTFHRYNPDGVTLNPFLGALNGVTAVYDGTRFDYRASVDYRFSPEILAYATFATGFKGGGVGPRPFNAAQARGFNPETVKTYEVGLKTDLFDRRLRLNVAGFYNDFKDAQLTLLSCPQYGGPGPCALPQNAGNAKQKGFEAEFQANPVEGLSLDGSISYIKWKWDCVNPAVVGAASGPCSSAPSVINLLADPLEGWKWAFGAQYLIALGGNNGTITPRIDVTRQMTLPGGTLRSAVGSPSDVYGRTPGYTLANVRLTWQSADEDLTVGLEVTNLFDRYYFLNKFDLVGAGSGVISGQPGRPREWAVTIKKKF
ncbi:MAG: TonB-dependent receptor [Sphingomonas sp.]|nr:TonB-dependent receptor [Sphingomonas sp.]